MNPVTSETIDRLHNLFDRIGGDLRATIIKVSHIYRGKPNLNDPKDKNTKNHNKVIKLLKQAATKSPEDVQKNAAISILSILKIYPNIRFASDEE